MEERQMNKRVEILMDREDFMTLLMRLRARGPLSDFSDEGGPLEALNIAVEEAQRNNDNYHFICNDSGCHGECRTAAHTDRYDE